MIRYYYYHIFYVGLMNIMVLVPYVLISHRFDGAVSSFPIAIAFGTLYSYVTSAAFQRFPGLGLPEIYKLFLPVWLANCLNMVGVVIWCTAGIIVLFSYSNTVGIFFDPEASAYLNLAVMAAASLWAASRTSRSVQFTHEVLLIVSTPIILWILFKALFSNWLDWDAIRLIADAGIRKPPSMVCIFASTFVFSGHMNITLFNRLNPSDLKFRLRWTIPIVGAFFFARLLFRADRLPWHPGGRQLFVRLERYDRQPDDEVRLHPARALPVPAALYVPVARVRHEHLAYGHGVFQSLLQKVQAADRRSQRACHQLVDLRGGWPG
ncbi:hypothetical protein OMP38_04750 [Cohnella ginsengisoli]|uniref:Uncharacterized protein n=1 Tax=Cohnella ginsengisoli TaxID=425004 RepID=A0A9X4QL19_9BACL|nr:hypothetical protein [Cohnella ginsengisoli]MDG0790234.1 hypothetical protein [Cohnella ginsengisoli]